MIQVKNLFKKYDNVEVLNNINLEFSKGKVYGIVGENGSGKTTFFRCLAGLEEYSGDIISENEPLKNHLGLLLTEPFFFSKITGEEYIRLLCNSRKIKVNNINEKNIFDLPLNKYAITYSTGMKKKLALTAILLQENDYFILDEPFNGVDMQSNIVLIEIIHKLKELNKIVLISSHIFSTLSETCDEIHLFSKEKTVRSIQRNDFNKLEEEMKDVSVGGKIEKLQLR